MITRKALLSASALYNILSSPFASCHMEMSWPYPLRSKYNPANSYSIIDYSMTSPLNADGSNFPCKGYQNDRPIETTISYTAGSTYNMTLAGSATHGGGSCQLSLSYDNGATFRVIKSMIGGCPLTSTYEFTIPRYAPAGIALLAWSWQNFEGNREFYMNCAEVNVASGAYARRQKRQPYSTFDQLPYIWKANLEGVNTCVTTEAQDPVYPNPGPDVIYGDGLSSSSIPSSGACDSPTPYGAAYRDLSDSSQPASSPPLQPDSPTASISNIYPRFSYEPLDDSAETSSISYPMFSYAPLTTTDTTSALPSPFLLSVDSIAQQRQAAASSKSYSTTTITIDCPATVTSTVYPSGATSTITLTPSPTYYTTAASACTGTSASCPCARKYACHELSPCTWACDAYTSPTTLASSSSARVSRSATWSTRSSGYTRSTTWISPRSSHSTVVITTTQTVTPVKPTSSSKPSPTGHPRYATGDVERYLPCVPGTFICTSDMTWDTCNYPDGGDPHTPSNAWVYGYPRNVSAGMECITFLSPYSSETDQYAQQALTPQGYFRDDRIVRARPDGDCDDDGSIKCTDGGSQFEVCDQGGWVLMGNVANGTTCSNGEIVASS